MTSINYYQINTDEGVYFTSDRMGVIHKFISKGSLNYETVAKFRVSFKKGFKPIKSYLFLTPAQMQEIENKAIAEGKFIM